MMDSASGSSASARNTHWPRPFSRGVTAVYYEASVLKEVRNAECVNLLDYGLPIVEKPTSIQIKELHLVSLNIRERQVERLYRNRSARPDESRSLQPVAEPARIFLDTDLL